MSDYIKREDALRAFNGSCSTVDADDILRHLHKSIYVIKNLPPADAVEVVRCNECIHNVGIRDNTEFYDNDIVCDYWESDGLYSTDFCSYGERAEA